MKVFAATIAFLAMLAPALAQSPGFTGWQSGVFDTGNNAVIMPADPASPPTLRNYLKHLFCDATAKTVPGVMQMNIMAVRNGTNTVIGFFSVKAGETDGIDFDVPLWGDVGSPITMQYKQGGPAHCMWNGFVGQ